MKNLKKVLALVLVFASLLGLATMASATKSDDYSDAASITHYEAVDVMSTIGVFDGISGAFSGDSILTREQAAKIITYMVLGKDKADSLVASVAPYTDVARDRWSAGSIAYCKNEGILAGVGNGRFEPTGKLTGVAFAKMCLVALGYDPDIEKLVGPDWAVNTSKLAIAGAKITGSLSQASLADEMSREDACQMALNTLQANMVDYDVRGTNITVNGMEISTGSSKAKPVASVTNYADADAVDYNGSGDGIQQFVEKYFPKLTKEFDTDSLGRPSNVWTYKAEEIGTYTRNDWLRKSWTTKASQGEMYNAVGSSVVNRLKSGKINGFNVNVDGCYVTSSDVIVSEEWNDVVSCYFDKNSSKAAGISDATQDTIGINEQSGNGVLTELYMNDSGDIYITMINTYLVKANADYNTTNKSVTVTPVAFDDGTVASDKATAGTAFLPTEISGDDFDVSGVKEGDYLLVNVSNIRDSYTKADLETVTPATVQKGTVTEYTDGTNVVMGGTTYSYNKVLKGSQKGTEFAINSEATLVLDTYGYIMCVDDSVDANRYVYIAKFANGDNLETSAIADAYFTDGTNEHISVSKVTLANNSTKTKVADIVGLDASNTGWYTFTGSTGGKYTLKEAEGASSKKVDNANSVELIKSGTVKFMSKSGVSELLNIRGNDKTIFVIKTKDGVSAYTGISNVPGVKLGTTSTEKVPVGWVIKNDFAKFVFVDVSNATGAEVDEGTSAAAYMFLLSTTNNVTHVDGMEYRKFTVVIDGKIEERWVSTELFDHTDYKNDVGRLYYSVKEDSNGRIKSGKEVGKGGSQKRFMTAMVKDGTAAELEKYKAANVGYATQEDTVIKRSGTTLTIPALKNASYKVNDDAEVVDPKDKSDLITTDKSNINLVIGKGCPLLKDPGASYETYLNTSVSQVTGLLGSKGLYGRVYVVVTEDDGDVVESLWIYVDDVYDITP